MTVISVVNRARGGFVYNKTNRDHPKYNIVMIGYKTEKSPEDQRRFPVTHTPVKDLQLTPV